MTDLRNLNRSVQSAEFPSHEWAQAVREWIDKATDWMEPGATVPCPNCEESVATLGAHWLGHPRYEWGCQRPMKLKTDEKFDGGAA